MVRIKYIYLQCVVDVTLQFNFVPKQVDGVLFSQVSSVPQGEDHQNVLGLCKIKERTHIVDHGACAIGTRNQTVAVERRCVGAFHVQPDTFIIEQIKQISAD